MADNYYSIDPSQFDYRALGRNIYGAARLGGAAALNAGRVAGRSALGAGKATLDYLGRVQYGATDTPESELETGFASPDELLAAKAARLNNFTAQEGTAAARAQAISDKITNRFMAYNPNQVTGMDTATGKRDISTVLGNYTGVSPAFARQAGIPVSDDEINSFAASRNAVQKTAAQAAQAQINKNIQAQNDFLKSSVSAARTAVQPQAQPAGLSDNEKMERYGTRFPDVLPMNPTWRDIRNQEDYRIRSQWVPTSNLRNGATTGAAAGSNNF
jgi:hypothetical protein